MVPEVDLRYLNISLSAKVPNGSPSQLPTVPEALLGILMSFPLSILRRIRGGNTPQESRLKLIDDVSGTILPGHLSLILGAPGSGKSSLLKAITGRLANQKDLTGSVSYCGWTREEVKKHGFELGQLVQYVSQIDEHSSLMTVREVSSISWARAISCYCMR